MLDMSLPELLRTLTAVLIALTIHELAHGLAALACGDTTAREDGRLTLNPVKHIDPVGFLLLVFAGFGWAKPVRFNPENLRNPVRDRITIALAGPFANFALAMVLALLFRLGLIQPSMNGINGFLLQLFMLNIGLGLFNLLPFPPLDGSHLISSWLERRNRKLAADFFKYGSLALLAVILLENFSKVEILPIGKLLVALGRWLLGFS